VPEPAVRYETALLLGQKRVLERVATAAPIDDTLAELMRFIEAQEEGLRCGILIVGDDGSHFLRGSGPALPEHYHLAFAGEPISPPYLGPCAQAAHQGVAVVVPDIANDLRWPESWRDLVLSSGLAACRSSPVFDSDGRVLAAFAIYYDRPRSPEPAHPQLIEIATHLAGIALESERSRVAVRERERQLHEILGALPAAIYTTDAAGHLTYHNEAAAELAGRRPEMGTDQWCVTWRLRWPDGRPMPHDECPMAVALNENRSITGAEIIAERPDGRRVPVLAYPTPLHDASGAVVGAVNMLMDITERKRGEEVLRQLNATLEDRVRERTRELETSVEERRKVEAALHEAQRLEAIGQLTGGVAHDFNNLLTVVLGQAENIVKTSGDPRIAQMAGMIRRAAGRGAQLTSQLLAFSRRQRLRPESVYVDRLIANIGDLLRRAVGETITVRLDLDTDCWPSLVDPAQFESALLNLAINARDAMPDGGAVVIESRNTAVSGNAAERLDLLPGDYVVVSVTDTGAGMTPAIQRKAFEPFFTTKDVGKGTGLGLAQIHGFAKQSGGTATIVSGVGKGTTVALHLPRAVVSATKEDTSEHAAKPAQLRGSTVLVVEDQPDVREVIDASLSELGYRILSASDAIEAHRILESEPAIHLLLTDVVMPNGASGIDLAHAALGVRPDIKILLVSGYPRGNHSAAEERSNDFALLAKPFRQAELAAAVSAALAGSGSAALSSQDFVSG
jgi:PAS domain S-box-containing protein